MDIVNSVVNLRSAETMGAIQMKIARKLLDNQQMQGAAAVKLIDAAGQIANRAGDELIAAATGLGAQVDVYG